MQQRCAWEQQRRTWAARRRRGRRLPPCRRNLHCGTSCHQVQQQRRRTWAAWGTRGRLPPALPPLPPEVGSCALRQVPSWKATAKTAHLGRLAPTRAPADARPPPAVGSCAGLATARAAGAMPLLRSIAAGAAYVKTQDTVGDEESIARFWSGIDKVMNAVHGPQAPQQQRTRAHKVVTVSGKSVHTRREWRTGTARQTLVQQHGWPALVSDASIQL